MIDGGKGQLSSALSVLANLGLDVPVLGLAKRQETVILADPLSGYKTVQLDKNSPVSLLLQRIRNEAHRFAVSYHGQLKGKRQTASTLDNIPGVGPATRKKLIRYFGSLRGVVIADQKTLIDVVGKNKARQIKTWLKGDARQSTE